MLLRFQENSLDNLLSTVLLHTLSPENSPLNRTRRSWCSHGSAQLGANLARVLHHSLLHPPLRWRCQGLCDTSIATSLETLPGPLPMRNAQKPKLHPVITSICASLPALGLPCTPEELWQEPLRSIENLGKMFPCLAFLGFIDVTR